MIYEYLSLHETLMFYKNIYHNKTFVQYITIWLLFTTLNVSFY